MQKRFCVWMLVMALKFQACNNWIEPAETLSEKIPGPTAETIFYVTDRPLPGLQIASRYGNGKTYHLSTGPFDVGHSISWDKQWIVFARGLFVNDQPQPLQIWKMKFNGDTKTPITPLGVDCQQPKFSPDGSKAAFSAQVEAKKEDRHIVVIKTDGSEWNQVTHDSTLIGFDHVYFSRLSWFPDGGKLVVDVTTQNARITQNVLGILDLPTGRFSVLAQANHLQPWQPNLSPLGDKVVFVSGAQGGGTNIYTMNVDGSGLQQLTHDGGSWQPDWSADGKKIAFSRNNPETYVE
ncbi:hypothetical protein L0244_14170, partial [bacterium]|nr:hypothetical protein [bacterium]